MGLPTIPLPKPRERYSVVTGPISDVCNLELLEEVEVIESRMQTNEMTTHLIKKPSVVQARNQFRKPLPSEQLDEMKHYRFV